MLYPSPKRQPEYITANKGTAASAMAPGKAPPLTGAVTLAHVAEKVGVSVAAVSAVLNSSHSRTRVSQATRSRIREVARELNYQPNELVRALKRGSTNNIGFCSLQVFDSTSAFFGSVLNGLLQGCAEHKKNFLIHGTLAGLSEDETYSQLLNGQLDGLVLYSHEVTPLTQRLVASRLPVVTVTSDVPDLPHVTVNYKQGGQLMAQYLVQKGYRHVLFWMPTETLPLSLQERFQALEETTTQHGLELEIFQPDLQQGVANDIKTIIARKNRPDVIVVYSDSVAREVILQCNAAGVLVPNDIAVTGFDGSSLASSDPTDLTTIYSPWAEVARIAVSLLVQQCSGKEIPFQTQLPAELVAGKTA